ncbi:MAG: nitroreductase family deazaflavin-dependent oxidoreductase [Chloroflexi bacterium]|nr:nitroreductase family deazaflavin-dependent oxidoreductase [Chloroflexota bacterium]
MPEKIWKTNPPKGFSRLLWRAPIWIYRLKLGWLMGGRFLLLHHSGRSSGLPRQTVLEIVAHDEMAGTYMIASGFGPKSDWFRNIKKSPEVSIEVGRSKLDMLAGPLEPEASGRAMVDYAHRNPRAAKELMRICGYRVDGSDEDYYELGRDIVPFVELTPRSGRD